MAKTKNGDGAVLYNLSGAARKLGRAPSTILAAMRAGDLRADVECVGGESKSAKLIRPDALREYRDTLAERLEAFKNDDDKVAEAKRLRAIAI